MFTLEKKSFDKNLVVKVAGYCSQNAGDSLLKMVQEIFEAGLAKNLILEFSQCHGVNSPGVARILEATEQVIEDFGGKVYICGLDKVKTSFFEMVGVLELAEAFSTEEEALKAL